MAQDYFSVKLKSKVEQVSQDYDFLSNSYTLSIVDPEKNKYLLKVIIENDFANFLPLKLKASFQNDQKNQGISAFEIQTQINLWMEIESTLKKENYEFQEDETIVKLEGVELFHKIGLSQQMVLEGIKWSDLIWSEVRLKTKKFMLKNSLSEIRLSDASLEASYLGGPVGSYRLRIKSVPGGEIQITSNEKFQMKDVDSTVDLEVISKEGVEQALNSKVSLRQYFNFARMFDKTIALVFKNQMHFKQEGKNDLFFKLSTTGKRTFKDAATKLEFQLKGNLHRRVLKELVTTILYVKLIDLNPSLTKSKEGTKAEYWLKPIVSSLDPISDNIVQKMLDDGYFKNDNSIVVLEADAKNMNLRFHGKEMTYETLQTYINARSLKRISSILDKHDFKEVNLEILPFFDFQEKVNIVQEEVFRPKVEEVKEQTQIEKILGDTPDVDEEIKQREKTQTPSIIKSKVIAKKQLPQARVFQNSHEGIWYDPNRPNVKFRLYRGANGIFETEQFVLGKKAKVGKSKTILFLKEKNKYQVTIPGFKTTYFFSPVSSGKIEYSFDKYKGELEKDKTYSAQIVKKYIQLREKGEI